MKRTLAAYTILVGLTAVMIGLYVNDLKILADILRAFVMPFP